MSLYFFNFYFLIGRYWVFLEGINEYISEKANNIKQINVI